MSIVRLETDIGLLTNRRMSIEVGLGIAALSGRRLSMDWSHRIGASPGARPAAGDGVLPRIDDLWEFDADLVSDDEWAERSAEPVDRVEWGQFVDAVYLGDDDAIPHVGVREFANGRSRYVRLRNDGTDVEVIGRPLAHPSYFFHATGERRRLLLDAVSGMRSRPEYLGLADRIADDLGAFQVLHLRRSDLQFGIRPYGEVTPDDLAASVASFLPDDLPIVVASEEDPDAELFVPFRERFGELLFVNELVLGEHGEAFRQLPVCEDNALGLITQEVAVRARRFVGTFGSTFSGYIHRERCRRDPTEPFLFTYDYSPGGARFEDGRYVDRRPGRYSWNRVGIGFDAAALSWLREWPECAVSADDEVDRDQLDAPFDRRDEPVHTLVCTDTKAYGDWQVDLLAHTFRRVGQPGELVRLVACPDGEPLWTDGARIVSTNGINHHPRAPEWYAGFNRLWSMQEWLSMERPTGSVLMLDCDMVFRATARWVAEPGVVIGQEWFDLARTDLLAQFLAPFTDAPPERLFPITWPAVFDADDLHRLMPSWLERCADLRAGTGRWESDMLALIIAIAESDLEVRYETTSAWTNWPESFVAGAPIIHYCQPVIDRSGRQMWFKQEYEAFEPIGVDPNDAELDYCRDLLHLLDEYTRVVREDARP